MRRPCFVADIGAASAKRGAKRRKGRKNSIFVVCLSLVVVRCVDGQSSGGGASVADTEEQESRTL